MRRRLIQPADLKALASHAPDLAQVLVSLSSDIALVIDQQGVVLSVAQDPHAPMTSQAQSWVGQHWADTVTEGTRRKIEMLLVDVGDTGLARRREVNHGSAVGGDIPVAYTALRLGKQGPVLAVGRDLRTVSAIQQRFLSMQQEVERSYWRTRQTETRQRQLMHVATDALLTVDAQTLCLLEGNPAAMQLLQAGDLPLAGRVAEQQFEARARPAVRELLLQAGRRGQAVEIRARLAGTHLSARLLAMPLRTNGGQRLLLRVRMPEPTASLSQPPETKRAGLGEGTGDGVVVTDLSGRVLGANRGFVHLVATADEDEVRGRPLADWLGPNEHDLAALLRAVRDSGLVQNRALSLCLAGQLPQGLAVTGMLLIEGDQECLGFIVRRQCHLHMAPAIPQAAPLPLGPAIEALASELGSTPLAQLLQRAEELARQHLVQRALEQSPSDAAAARLLGISGAQLAKLKNELALALAAAAGR